MSEDGHKYFFGQMPEMPWKREENMDKEFKILVLEMLLGITNLLLLMVTKRVSTQEELDLIKDTTHRIAEYDKRYLG